MGWNVGDGRYRGRADKSNFAVLRNEKTGTLAAEGYIECTAGPQAGQRIKYRGYISAAGGGPSEKNADTTSDELRAMGASLAKGWRDLTGIGTKEIEFTAMADTNTETGRTYYRAAFVRPPAAINRAREVSDIELEGLPPPPLPKTNGASGGPVPQAAGPQEEEEVAFP